MSTTSASPHHPDSTASRGDRGTASFGHPASASDIRQFQSFAYRGRAFLCGAQPLENGTFLPLVICVGAAPGRQTELPRDTDAYRTAAEALRHSEQQAVRWLLEQEDCRGQE
jgi:hypothetical protein